MFPALVIPRILLILLLAAGTGILSAQPAATEDIRGPKPLVEIPQPEKPPVALWSAIAGGTLLLALAAYLWKRRTTRQKAAVPSEVALSALTRIERTHDSITAEAFANQAAQTLRQYIADRFGIAAPRRTTEEFLHALIEHDSLAAEGDHLRSFLKSCDLAKFAGSNLTPEQRHQLIQAARTFIRSADKPLPNTNSGPSTP